MLGGNVFAQTTSLFSLNLTSVSALNEEQTQRYNKLANNPEFNALYLVSVADLYAVQNDGNVLIDLPFLPCDVVTVGAMYADFVSDDHYSWQGRKQDIVTEEDCESASLLLLRNGSDYRGYFQTGAESYALYSLTGGIHVMAQFAAIEEGHEDCGTTGYEETNTINNTLTACQTAQNRVRVLVVYTADAANVDPDIVNTINAAITDVNGTMAVSQINPDAHLILAHQQQVSFTEHLINGNSGITLDLATLQSPNTFGGSPAIHALRNTHKADLVVLLVSGDYNGIYGSVVNIFPDEADAFAIVDVTNAMSKRHSFAHEVGHLFGGHHHDDPSTSPVYAKGKQFGAGKKYSTMMVSGGAIHPKHGRYNYFANPAVKHGSWKTGDADSREVARRIGETYPTIAAFYPDLVPVLFGLNLNASISDCGNTIEAQVVPTCGTPPYTATYQISTSLIGWTTAAGSGMTNSIPFILSNQPCAKVFFLRVIVKDALNHTAIKTVSVLYQCDDCDPRGPFRPGHSQSAITENTMFATYSPGSDYIDATLSLIESTELESVSLVDLAGKEVWQTGMLSFPAGTTPVQIPVQQLAAGIYTLKVLGANVSLSTRILIQQ